MSRAKGRWPLLLDIKVCGVFYWLAQGVLLVYPLYLALRMANLNYKDRNTWPFTIFDMDGVLVTTASYTLDFFLPLLLVFCLLLLYSASYEEHGAEYLYSLPTSRLFLVLGRWGRMVLSLLPGYLLNLWAFWRAGNQLLTQGMGEAPLPFWMWCRACLPSVVFLCGLALFLMVVGKKLFYATLVIGGLTLVEALSQGSLLGRWTFFINLASNGYRSAIQVMENRLFYTGMGLILVVLSYGIAVTKCYRKRI